MSRSQKKPPRSEPSEVGWSPRIRLLASAFLVFHLAAVIAAPLGFATRATPADPPSPALMPLIRVVQPYMDAAFLNHGYAFFAPNPPAASSLLRYQVDRDGGETVEGVLPDLKTHWPRLYYHRHFMLSEQLSARFVPSTPPPDADPMMLAGWRAQNRSFRAAWMSFEDHLLEKHGGRTVQMQFYDHRPPGVGEFVAGSALNAEELYRPRESSWPEAPP